MALTAGHYSTDSTLVHRQSFEAIPITSPANNYPSSQRPPESTAAMEQSDHLKGYMVGNLSDVEPRFICTHCERVLREPMQGDCGHRYCKVCVFSKFAEAKERGDSSLCSECGSGEPTEISPDRTYPDNAMKREINKVLKVLCPNTPCTELMSVSALSDHHKVCEFKPQRCDQCNRLVAAAEMQHHRDKLCLKRLVPCDICKQTVVFDTINDHVTTTCPGTTVQCQFCLARIKDSDDAKTNHWTNECPVGWQDGKPCPYGCTDMTEDGGWKTHREKCVAIHTDRLLAMCRQKHHDEKLKASSDVDILVYQPTEGKSKHSAKGVTSDSSMLKDTATVIPASEFAGSDFDDLKNLIHRIRMLEQRSKEISLPAGALLGQSGDQKLAKKYLSDLSKSLEQGDKLSELLEVIKKQFDSCYDKIRTYETRLQKDIEKKLDIERKHQELVKLLAYKEMKLLDLERRVEILEHAGYDGTLIWKITDVRKRKEEAREGKVCSIYSPPFYTGKAGYKMCGRLYLNGDGAGKNTHISLFFVIMRGAFDALLPWPFSKKVSMMLLDQNFEEHVIDAFKPDTSSSSFKRPTTDMNIASGCPLFMPLADFENQSRGYVKDDTMFIKFIVDKSDLPT